MVGLLSQHDILRLDETSDTGGVEFVAIVKDGKPFKVNIADLVNGAPQKIVDLTGSADVDTETDIVFCIVTLTANLVDPSTAKKQVRIRNISGTTTITADAGTVETSTLTVGQATTLAPRATGWFQI